MASSAKTDVFAPTKLHETQHDRAMRSPSCSVAYLHHFVQATVSLRKICTCESHQTTRHRHRRAIFSFYGLSAIDQ